MRSALPKVLHPVAGVPMIRHTVRSVKRIDPAPLIVVTSPDARDAIADALGDDVEFVEQPDPLGTGNALAVAIDRVPFATRQLLLTNGDLPLIGEGTIARLVALHLERSAALTLVTATLPAAEGYPVGLLPVSLDPAAEVDTPVLHRFRRESEHMKGDHKFRRPT